MHSQIEGAIVIYCIIDEVLKALKHKNGIRTIFSDAEILLIAIIAMLYYGGNYTKAIKFCMDLLKKKISLSRFTRRLKRLDNLYFSVFNLVIKLIKQKIPLSQVEDFMIDTFPIPVCDNIRANRCKLAPGLKFRGYIASKRRYYHGLKLHIVVSDKRYIVEFEVTEASKNDVIGLYLLPLNLEGKILYGDRAYNDYFAEDALRECDNIKLEVIRKKNSKRFDYYKQKLVTYFNYEFS